MDRPPSPSPASATMPPPQKPPTEVKFARSVFNKLGETLDNFKLHALPLLSLYEQWKNLQSSLAAAEASIEARAKELELKEREIAEIEQKLSDLKVKQEELELQEKSVSERGKKVELREESVRECCEAIEAKNREIETRRDELGLREKGFDERFKVLKFNEKEINEALEVKEKEIRELGGALEVKEKEIRELGGALEAKRRKISEECRVLEDGKREIEEQCRCLVGREKELSERCRWLGLREKKIREDIKGLDLEKRRAVEEFEGLREKEREIVERCRGLEERERDIEDRSRDQELRGKEMRELGEFLETRAKEIVEGTRVLEERKKKGMDGASRGLKELDERGKELELREKKIGEHEKALELREKELLELRRKVELKEREVEKGFQDCCEELRVKKEQLVDSRKVLGTKEREIKEQVRDLELKQERMNEQWKALELKEKEISSSLKALELKEKEINEGFKALEGQISGTCKVVALVEKEGARTVETNTVVSKANKTDDGLLSVKVKEEQVGECFTELDMNVKQVEDCCSFPALEGPTSGHRTVVKPEKQTNQSFEAADLKAMLIKKCSSLFKQANEILKVQDVEGKQDEDCCCAAGLKEGQTSDTCTLTEEQELQGCDKVDFGEKLKSEEPQADNLPLRSAVDSGFLTEMQLLFTNTDARGITSYLTEQAKKDDMWHEKMLGLRKEIPGLIQSLITEQKHLQAAICTCAFKMEDVFAPHCLLEAHLKYIHQRVEEIVKEANATAQDDAANMELNALRDVLICISVFKLKYSVASFELRIKQLEKDMEERTATHILKEKKSDQNLGKKAELIESAPTDTINPGQEKKRRASSPLSPKQNKPSRSMSRERPSPHSRLSPHGQAAHVLPFTNFVATTRYLSPTNWPGLQLPPPGAIYGIPYNIGRGTYGVSGLYPVGYHTPAIHLRGQGQRTDRTNDSFVVNTSTHWRRV